MDKNSNQKSVQKNVIGSKIRDLRVRQGVTQTDFAFQLNNYGVSLTNSALSKVESGHRRVMDYELVGFSQCLGVSIGSIFDELSIESPQKSSKSKSNT